MQTCGLEERQIVVPGVGEEAKITERGKGWAGTWWSVWGRQVHIAIGWESKRGLILQLLARSK